MRLVLVAKDVDIKTAAGGLTAYFPNNRRCALPEKLRA
jgi:hypothetical protein